MSNAFIALSGCPVAVGNIVVVMSVCNRDASIALENLKWQRELGSSKRFEFVLAHDPSLPGRITKELVKVASATYIRVEEFQYPEPEIPHWPCGPNDAFHATAEYMQKRGRPWFWMEPDCMVLKRGWMEVLEAEYDRIGKPFMGSIVPGLGHMNGVAVYAANTPELLPAAMNAKSVAWDSACKEQMVPFSHDASRLMQHVWGMNGDSFTPYGGSLPNFRTDVAMRQVSPTAVILHRCKDTSLIEQLRKRRHEN